ncbi:MULTISPECIES: hypothetical protein [Spongiibacter]|uniref:hypothetical protein n=1 Tax=Spongiibacter TaxID=630749 RepID=UPI000C621965|nr:MULTISPECIES: hypothetical protein [Spongiibacter]MAY39766.1 hypothetical protein [Spongiibacter sp.]|tara:strand:+ start:853 stop:2178 length:1326 start_codon:yes stop_codon:yes gene_type:complete
MSEDLELHEIVDNYLHKLVALHEVVPYQMAMASVVAQDSAKKHKAFLDEKAEKIEETEGSTSYKLDFKDVKRSSRLGHRSDRAKTVLELLPRNFVVSFVSEYDSYLGKLITQILRYKPEIINSEEKNISLSELVNLGSVNAAREKIFAKEVESILRSSHSDQFLWMERVFSIPLTKGLESWPSFIELTERRNLFVHCDGVVSDQYINVCKNNKVVLGSDICVRKKLKVDKKYLRQSFEVLYEIGLKLSQVLWRKLSPADIKKAESSLSHFTYELLIEENYRLAKNLLDFACCTLKKWGSEGDRLVYVVNRALAYKFSGDNDRCQEILDTEDWSACGDNYNLCVSVLRDDFDDAKKLMLRIGSSGSVSEVDYAEWPCFKEFRSTAEFAEAFNEVFGYPPKSIEQIDKEDVPDSEDVNEEPLPSSDDGLEETLNHPDLENEKV